MTKRNKTKKLGVCINIHSDSNILLETAIKISKQDKCPWYVIFIENECTELDSVEKQQLEQILDKASEAGAEIIRFPSLSTSQGIITAAELHQLTHIIIGKRRKSRLLNALFPPLSTKLLKYDNSFELQVVSLNSNSTTETYSSRFKSWRAYGASIGIILLLTIIVEIVQESLPEYKFNASIYNVSMLYLLAIVFCAHRYGLLPAISAAIISFCLYNYFFIPPFYAFGLGQISDALNFILFFSASLISATVANIYKRNMAALSERELATSALLSLSKGIAGLSKTNEVVVSLTRHLKEILQSDVVFYLANYAVYPKDTSQPKNIRTAYQKAYKLQKKLHHYGWMLCPVSTPREKLGVIAIKDSKLYHSQRLIDALCYQAALAIEHTQLMRESEKIKLEHHRESLRSALLSSVSHDLKTPLVSIIGSLSSIRHMEKSLSKTEKQELIDTAINEAERLNQSISNILDMTRIESGTIKLKKEWADIYALFTECIQRRASLLEKHNVTVKNSNTPINIKVDTVLFTQAIQNILENAAKHTPKKSKIELSATTKDSTVIITISDNGPGIAPSERHKVFDKFTRIEKRDASTAGTGLGLAICKAIIELHKGSIKITNNAKSKGTSIVITLPVRKKIHE